ncbi:hypothetical protein GGI09_000345, partial [Coemansia sp. S100]
IGRGRVCPACVATYADAAAASTMVCCDVCGVWVHAACDPSLTPPVYAALIAREDAAYVCPACGPLRDAPAECLPRCLRGAIEADDAMESDGIITMPEIETEAANLLLSLTQSDVRFDYERFALDRLQARFCQPPPADARCCFLCGLRGDGFSGPQQLGRLVPFGSSTSAPAPAWAHVECLAWAWGPRSVDAGRRLVRFEGALTDAGCSCALCARPGASFHCCAPVPCADAAYHLPCLLVAAAQPASSSSSEIQYSAAWRRALCPAHAPKYSAMMPVDDPAAQPPTLSDVCVISHVLCATADDADDCFTRIGNLVVLAWGSVSETGIMPLVVDHVCLPSEGFYIARYFCLAGTCYTIGLQTFIDTSRSMWRGWISPMSVAPSDIVTTEMPADAVSDALLSDLLAQLFRRYAADGDQFLVNLAVAYPLRFLGLDRYSLASLLGTKVKHYDRLLMSESVISIPTNTLHTHNSPTSFVD